MPNRSVRLREEVSSQENGPRGCSEQPRQLHEPMLVPPERGHWQNSVLLFPDSPDYLREQGYRGKSIKEEVGPIKGQRVPECFLLRRRGRPLSCQRFPIFAESFVGGVSTRLSICVALSEHKLSRGWVLEYHPSWWRGRNGCRNLTHSEAGQTISTAPFASKLITSAQDVSSAALNRCGDLTAKSWGSSSEFKCLTLFYNP